MVEEMLSYIEEHLMDVKEAYDNADDEDDYYEGSIETLEHLLAKFGRNHD
jgi:S-ribosylhomocysteine lyase LuxS involved in autoinducer biosynthesis